MAWARWPLAACAMRRREDLVLRHKQTHARASSSKLPWNRNRNRIANRTNPVSLDYYIALGTLLPNSNRDPDPFAVWPLVRSFLHMQYAMAWAASICQCPRRAAPHAVGWAARFFLIAHFSSFSISILDPPRCMYKLSPFLQPITVPVKGYGYG